MGEFRAAIILIDALIKAYPNHKILVTSTTPTGSKAVSEQYQNKILHIPIKLYRARCIDGWYNVVH
jgi:3-deoxy-D-manno-octulosonic-acid transferase